jgi:signal transduction histidine kinase/CheY-like chemotaxis protein
MPALSIFGVLRGALAVAVILAALTGAVLSGLAETTNLWPDEAPNLGLMIILFTLVSLAARLGDWGASNDSASSVVERFQDLTCSWIVRLDFGTKMVALPLMKAESRRSLPFASFFQASDPAGLLDFMSRLEGMAEDSGIAAEVDHALLRVNIPGEPTRLVSAALLSATSGHAWLALHAQKEHEDISSRLERAETELAKMRIREERLLSVASHEMRTPISILTMLAEELKSGADWCEVEFSFETTLNRLTGILDDLRVAGDEAGAAGTFTLNELSEQVLDAFHGAAVAQGMTIRLALSQHSQTPLVGDPARVIIALSKVVHNAIVHSKGNVVVLGAMLTPKNEKGGQVSWFVSDDGVGVDTDLQESLFDPFTSRDEAGLGTGQATGLGLYTARKALRLMGGDIELKRTGEVGSEFLITHPVRIAVAEENGADDQMNDERREIAYPDKAVLLVEDNKLVGELTASRLRRLFGTVHWAETGTEGLAMFQDERPDILLIDQLLPGMTGNELIEQVRLADPKVPIVGVTASTMGSECEVLEAAGANIAVEKPLSFSQLQVLVSDFLGAGRKA